MKHFKDAKYCQTLDSSVGRAEDCRGNIAEILRSLVRLRFEGFFFDLKKILNK
jgi:hypothetical protein